MKPVKIIRRTETEEQKTVRYSNESLKRFLNANRKIGKFEF